MVASTPSSPMMRPGCKGMDMRYAVATDIVGPVAILWDIENCSIPAGVPAEDVAGNIRTALRLHPAVKGAVTVFSAYGDFNQFPRRLREGCQRTGVNLIDVPNGRKDAADKAILVDMFLFAIDNPPPSTIFLITGDIDFSAALHKLGQRGFTVVLGVPAGVGISPALCSAGTYVWDWPSLARGEGLTPAKWALPRLGWFTTAVTESAAPVASPGPGTANTIANTTPGNTVASSNGGGARTGLMTVTATNVTSPKSNSSNSSPSGSPRKFGLMENSQLCRDEACAGGKGGVAINGNGDGRGGGGDGLAVEDGVDGKGEFGERAVRAAVEGGVGLVVDGEGAELSSSSARTVGGVTSTVSVAEKESRRDENQISGASLLSSPTRDQGVARKLFGLSQSESSGPDGSLSGYQHSTSSGGGYGYGGRGGVGSLDGGKGWHSVGHVGVANGNGSPPLNRGSSLNGYARLPKRDVSGWSPAAPSDLVGLKQQIVKLLVEHGGKLDLVRVPPEYRKAYGRPLYLSEYGASKLIHLVEKMKDAMFVNGEGTKKMVLLRRGLGAGGAMLTGRVGMFVSTGGAGGQSAGVEESAPGGRTPGNSFQITKQQQEQEAFRKRESMAAVPKGRGMWGAIARETPTMITGLRVPAVSRGKLDAVGVGETVDPMGGVISQKTVSDDEAGEDILLGEMSPDEEGDEIIMFDEGPRVVENPKLAREGRGGAAAGLGAVGREGGVVRWGGANGYGPGRGDGGGAGGGGCVVIERESDLFLSAAGGRRSEAGELFPDSGGVTLTGEGCLSDRAYHRRHDVIGTRGRERWMHFRRIHGDDDDIDGDDDEADEDDFVVDDDGAERFVNNGEVCAQVGLEIFRREVEELLVSHACKITVKNFPELYRQRYSRELDCITYGVLDLVSLIKKVGDVAIVVEDEVTKVPCVVASF